MRIYNECAENLTQKLLVPSSSGQSIEIFSLISLCTLNVILKCAFSVDEDVQELGDRMPYVKNITDLGRVIIERMYRPHWLIDFVYFRSQHGKEFAKMCQFSHAYAKQVIRNRQDQLKGGEDPSKTQRSVIAASRSNYRCGTGVGWGRRVLLGLLSHVTSTLTLLVWFSCEALVVTFITATLIVCTSKLQGTP